MAEFVSQMTFDVREDDGELIDEAWLDSIKDSSFWDINRWLSYRILLPADEFTVARMRVSDWWVGYSGASGFHPSFHVKTRGNVRHYAAMKMACKTDSTGLFKSILSSDFDRIEELVQKTLGIGRYAVVAENADSASRLFMDGSQ